MLLSSIITCKNRANPRKSAGITTVFLFLETLGRTLGPIHMIGGGTQNTLLCQLTANATGKQAIAGPVEATAMGNILVQAMALGHLKSLDELREVVRNSTELTTYDPHPDPHQDDAYGTLLRIMAS